jgi:hypothetical protein
LSTQPSRTAPSLRAPLAGVSTLLLVSLILGASLNATKPAVRYAGPDRAVERAAFRPLTASLAKAVRRMVGSDQHKPCLYASARVAFADAGQARSLWTPADAPAPAVALLRVWLLDLPPPAAA